MEGAFKGEDEIALAFLSGREQCLKGSLESLRRDIIRIAALEGELSTRDKDDLVKYLGKYIGLWREGVYDLITQYESIFLANVQEGNALSPKLHALLQISHIALLPLDATKGKDASNPSASKRANKLVAPSMWLLTQEDLGSTDLTSSPSSTLNSTPPFHTPPSLLTSFTPLAAHANEVIEVLNALRACAPFSVATGEGQTIFHYVKAVFEVEELSAVDSGNSTGLSRESVVALAFARAFFEAWTPWLLNALAVGVFGLAEIRLQPKGTKEGSNSELVQLLEGWQRWAQEAST
ncbi:Dor1-domain-containing protein [Lentinula edodes]|uniref:Conserved oligomeric Golgi complex subunit 8 n=1 Tax=Lentinula edodes TaxID=5353 RepID=A0A1Q3ECW1_LENED|nr:Dor1-domain-containing protein [Lentinula edodes]